MEETKTPMSSSIKLDMDEKGKPVNSTMYRGMIGSLLYLTASRPDIMYSVCLYARFQSCPKESHLSVVKRILRYLKGTMDIGLWYPKGDNFELIGYSDADFAGCKVERKSTSGTCHFLGHSLVSWHSKKQNSGLFSSFSVRLRLWVSDCSFSSHFPLSLDSFFSFFVSLDGTKKRDDTSKAQGKHPAEPSQPEFEGLFRRMGWLLVVTISKPIFLTLMWAFYSRATYELGGPVLSTMREVEIRLSPESICRILDIPSVGLRVYEAKAWPTVPGFEPREAVQRLCELADP
ncbi:Retrovirus-related Pol polyprotein from transposon RE1 [Vitis vinifera]|uniref:Retrovirus-related Pol polyprotein from transposon RE1 n=1 Tax=Vitis vinifera TaxID=29760 RepID=A0A438HNJ8_VITVI|nr:Retrovirus-related Pol polyprotein from transposon RE1 [Vitis vinifera]